MESCNFDVFLSYSRDDKSDVEALANKLRKRGIKPWLDKWNLVPGTPWQPEIESALCECSSCAVFVGKTGLGPWQNEEMRAAIQRRVTDSGSNFRVIPVLLPGASHNGNRSLPTFLVATTWVEFANTLNDNDAFHRLISGIRGLQPGPVRHRDAKQTEYVLVVSAILSEVAKPKIEAIVEHLRQLTGDATITIKKVESGSVRITLEGSFDGFEKLRSLVDEGSLTSVLGIAISEIYLTTEELWLQTRAIKAKRQEEHRARPQAEPKSVLSVQDDAVELAPEVLAAVVEKKATCPFVSSAIATRFLPVRNEHTNPLASIEDVRALGNTGGGDLGDQLVLFATGNHAFMRGSDDELNQKAPDGLFSLEFPGSQGSHPGHSGILEGDPRELDSGRLSLSAFQRLARLASNGLIKRSDVGKFIAENLHRDPKSKVFGTGVGRLLADDLGQFVASLGLDLLEKLRRSGDKSVHREVGEKLTRLLGEDNLVGSCGEYGLLFAFLANSPKTKELDGEPALSLEDIESMFVDRRLPAGWEMWRKTRADWIINTTALAITARKAYLDRQK